MRTTTFKWVFPIAFLTICTVLLAFKPAPASLAKTTLYFKYQPASNFSSGAVTSNSNWELVAPSEICEQETDDVACSFSITVPELEEANYLTGNNPSSRVTIQANGSSGYYHVDDVLDNINPSRDILDSKANVERP